MTKPRIQSLWRTWRWPVVVVALAAAAWGAKVAFFTDPPAPEVITVAVERGERAQVPAEPVARVLDTTGAGDLYASGFLYGYAQGLDLAACGRLGSLAAAEIIGHVGARPAISLTTLL